MSKCWKPHVETGSFLFKSINIIMNVYVIFFFLDVSLVFLIYFTNSARLTVSRRRALDILKIIFQRVLIWGVCDERCWCVHKYRCYYWNINTCLLEIISRSRLKEEEEKTVSRRYISKYFYCDSESIRLVFKKIKAQLIWRPRQPKNQTAPKIITL